MFEVYENESGEFGWRLKAYNNEIVASGEGYKTRWGAHEAIERIKDIAENAEIVDKD